MALNPIGDQVSITTSGSSAKSAAQSHKTKYLRVVAKSNCLLYTSPSPRD